MKSRLRAIPSVDRILQALGETGVPRPLVVDFVRRELKGLRVKGVIPPEGELMTRLQARLRELGESRLRPVVNGTGILVHTNLGRAPLGRDAVHALAAVGSSYSNLEYNLVEGTRGGRAAYLERALAVLCGAEAATVVNNNAAALVLILRHLCAGTKNEVVISRGELVQIGGGFRIPEVLESSGARLLEVGTTNRTSLADYARAIGRNTALILTVHRSNFFMEGFVESPPPEGIAALARKRRVPFVEDLGSGAVMDTRVLGDGLEHEPTPAEVLKRGVDLVCFSGDKLFGGPQAGIIAGGRRLVAGLKQAPLFRALRCDKLVMSALEATADAHLRNGSAGPAVSGIPLVDMLRVSVEDLRTRAERMVAALRGLSISAKAGESHAQIGGGTLPRSAMPSITVGLSSPTLSAQEIAQRLRAQPLPVIGYIARGVLKLDLRTILPRQDDDVVRAIRAASAAPARPASASVR
jgi:L-seryl-tRNA(Ser) seleniumtransferase